MAWWWGDVLTAYDNFVVKGSIGGASIHLTGSTTIQKQFASGLHLLSLPSNPSGSKLSAALIGQSQSKVAQWNSQAGTPHYEVVGENSTLPLAAMEVGRGYWVHLDSPIMLTVSTEQALKDQSFTLSLTSGWNLIGYPFTDSMLFDLDAIQVRENGSATALSLREAAQQGWLKDVFWTYIEGKGYLVVHPTLPHALRELEPWRAYWVHATRPLEIILPSHSRLSALNRAAVTRRSKSADEWSLQLVVRGQGSEDTCLLGVSRVAGSGEYVVRKPPPAPEPGPTLYFPSIPNQNGQSQPYAVSLRSTLAPQAKWDVEVNPQGSSQPLMLTMPNLAELPRSLKVWLVDMKTGQRRYMRTVNSYNVNSDGKPRRFQIIVEPAGVERKLLSALAASGGSGKPVLLSFVLGNEAYVSMEVINPTGKLVARSPVPVRRSAGLNTLIWDGRDSRGSILSRGVYLFRVTATDDEGRMMSLVRPLSLR
jgi:hypothetical protein